MKRAPGPESAIVQRSYEWEKFEDTTLIICKNLIKQTNGIVNCKL